ncbi:MAG: HEAT repeat domain-containing protein, partial [Elusimicrobiota bacterium]
MTTGANASTFDIQQDGDSIEIVAVSTPATPSPAPAAPKSLAPSGIDYSTWTVGDLSRRYVETWRRNEKKAILRAVGGKKPISFRDIRWLLNLYSRSDPGVRFHAERSLRRLGPMDKNFESFFVRILKDEDPYLRMFGLIGASRLKSKEARPAILKIARGRFSHPQPMFRMNAEDANDWHLRFLALRVLAINDDPEAFALLEKRSKDAPQVGGIMACFYWERSLPKFVKWAESRSKRNQARARAAWRTDVPLEDLKKTKGKLRKIVFSKRRKMESRHQAAIKL